MPSEKNPTDPPADDNRGRANIVALVCVVLLLAAALWLFKALQQSNDLQNCVASSRRDCIDLTRPEGKAP